MQMRDARKRKKLTLDDVQRLTREHGYEVHRATISRIERGEVRPLHATVEALRKVYGRHVEIPTKAA